MKPGRSLMSARHPAAPRPDSDNRHVVTVDGVRVYDADTLGDEPWDTASYYFRSDDELVMKAKDNE